MQNPYAIGKHVYLRAPTLQDVSGSWHEWFSDEEVTRNLFRPFPNTIEAQRAFFDSRVLAGEDVILSVVAINTNKHIGVASISGINWVHRFADVALVIGDGEYRSKAVYAIEAFLVLLKVAFNRLNLDNVKGGYLEGNRHSQEILRLARFREVGRYVGLCRVDQKPIDHIVVQLSRADWAKRNGF